MRLIQTIRAIRTLQRDLATAYGEKARAQVVAIYNSGAYRPWTFTVCLHTGEAFAFKHKKKCGTVDLLFGRFVPSETIEVIRKQTEHCLHVA